MPDCLAGLLVQSAELLSTALLNAQRILPPRYAFPPQGATSH
jgi:hypothetical protein